MSGGRGQEIRHRDPVLRAFQHRHRVACRHRGRLLHGEVGPGPSGGEEPLDQVRDVEEAREHPARCPRSRHPQHRVGDLPPLADHGVRTVDALQRQVLADVPRSNRSPQLGGPEVEVVDRVGVDGLLGAAVVLRVADRVAVDAADLQAHRVTGRPLVDP
jgi:hypothetical protein